jgi:hypothetical protein
MKTDPGKWLYPSLILCAVLSFYFEYPSLLGMCVGILLGAFNLLIIKEFVKAILIEKPRNALKLGMIAGIKFPLLYVLGYVLLSLNFFSPWTFLIGLTTSIGFAVMGGFFEQLKPKGVA